MATVTSSKRQLTHTSNTYESNGDVTIGGNLNINGTTTTIDTANLLVEDKNIIIGDVSSPTDSTADGGGITLKGASDKTINWVNSTDSWTSNQKFSAPSLTLTGLTTSSETTALLINASNQVVKRVLGSNAFNSTSFAPLASPALTGNPTAPTQSSSENSTKIATTAYVKNQGYVTSNTQLSNETVQDIVGGMLTGNTESGITVTYDDAANEIDFTVASQTDQNFTTTLKNKLDGIAASANNYSLPAGSSSTRGGFKIGFSESGKNYPVEVSSEKMYVNVA